jgi:hypothetical protein
MKKIITLFVFIFALSFNANAQEAKTASELGKADAKAVAELVKIDSQTVTALEGLFEMKHQTLLTEGISEERKQVLAEVIELKLAATLDAEQVEKLKANQELYKKLIKN